jgi:hypothetical protein
MLTVLLVANFQGEGEGEMSKLEELQPGRPKWAMELWPGWFDRWLEEHNTFPLESEQRGFNSVFSWIHISRQPGFW